MGQTTSNIVKKCTYPFTGWGGSQTSGSNSSKDLVATRGVTLFVYKRQGSMYFDEEGDLAHEFYEEKTLKKGSKTITVMKQRKKNLRPQGEVDLPHPRLHVDLPIAICDAPFS